MFRITFFLMQNASEEGYHVDHLLCRYKLIDGMCENHIIKYLPLKIYFNALPGALPTVTLT